MAAVVVRAGNPKYHARNKNRGETFHVEVPPAFFELASDLWEPPDEAELAEWGFVVVS